MPVYGAAVALGVDEIEFDLWSMKDGEIVSIHDDTILTDECQLILDADIKDTVLKLRRLLCLNYMETEFMMIQMRYRR